MEKLVIIGSGMAGGKLVEELTRMSDLPFDITIIGDEPYGNYDRIKLTSLLKEDEVIDFWLNSKEWYKANNINALLGQKVLEIDRKNKNVITDKGNSIPYNKLVIASGSHPYIPSIEGVDQKGVMTLRNLTDVKNIKKWIQDRSKVLVIGGGLLGLELAYTLYELGKEVTVSHLVDSLMELQLNREAAKYLEEKLKKIGVRFIMNTYITKISPPDTSAFKIVFKNGITLDTEAVIINCGIKPAKELAEIAGLKVNTGIMVNDRLQTDDENIYALGECIEYNGQTYGVIAPIYEQARTLAKLFYGEDVIYPNSVIPPTKLKSEVAAIAMGKIDEEETDEVIYYKNPISYVYKKLIINDNKLIGAHLVGEDLNSDALGVYYTAKLPLPNRIEQLLFPGVHKPDSSSLAVYWPDSITICDCNGISCGTIRDSIRKHGDDIDIIVKETRAGTSCGTCKNRIQSIIDNTYDAIIIGAGLGGLSVAATLSKYGKRVLVIEKHDKVGGYASSFTREGYEFDVSLHNMGPITGSIEKIFEDLDLLNKIKYVPFDNFQRIIFPKHNIDIPKGIDNFTEVLSKEFPDEKEGIKKIFDEIKYIRKGFDEFEELSLGGNPEEMISPMLAVKYPQFVDLVYTTFDELLDQYIKNAELKGLISNLWWYFGLPPSRVASILYSVPSASYFEYGGGNIQGTSQALSNALSEIVISNHGKIILNTEVKKILIADKKAECVLTDEGEIFYSDLIISNAGAKNTFLELSDEEQIKKRYRRKVDNQEISLSGLQLYLGLDCDPRELNMKDHSFTVFFSYNHDENYQYIINGEYDKTFFSCSNYSYFDKTTSPEGKGIINIFSLDHINNWKELSESAYLKKKLEVTEIIIKKVEKHIPNLSKHIVVKELGTPKTMHRYTYNPDGSIYGPSQLVEQSGMNRLQPFTPVKGLFIVGSSIYPGGGYPSVISSGYKTAKMILYNEKKDKLGVGQPRSF
ncbi:MAG: FAD-dependent oxidoreductase [Spirochaetes bacterium]|nr:FAD-dependent oxidoreductase [Spirochaetota bacterium]